jgi:hypothetical protein
MLLIELHLRICIKVLCGFYAKFVNSSAVLKVAVQEQQLDHPVAHPYIICPEAFRR